MTPPDPVGALVDAVLDDVVLAPVDLARLATAGEVTRAVVLAEARPPGEAAAALAAVAEAVGRAGDAGRAHELVGLALSATPDRCQSTELLVSCAEAEALAGDTATARELIVEAHARCRPWEVHRGRAVEVASRHALVLHEVGAAAEAREAAADAEDRARAVPSRGWRDDALGRAAAVWAALGASGRSSALADELADPWSRVEVLVAIARAPSTPQGVASNALRRAGEEAARIDYAAWRAEAMGAVAVARDLRGEAAGAEVLTATLSDPVWAAETWLALAANAVARGDADGAARRVGRGRDAARRCDYGWWHRRGEALQRLACAHAATGGPASARAMSSWTRTRQALAAVALGLAEGLSAAAAGNAPPPAAEVEHAVALIESLAPDPARAVAAIALLDLRRRPGDRRS